MAAVGGKAMTRYEAALEQRPDCAEALQQLESLCTAAGGDAAMCSFKLSPRATWQPACMGKTPRHANTSTNHAARESHRSIGSYRAHCGGGWLAHTAALRLTHFAAWQCNKRQTGQEQPALRCCRQFLAASQ